MEQEHTQEQEQPFERALTDTACTQLQEDFRNFLEHFTLPEDDAISQLSQGTAEQVYIARAQEMDQMDRTSMDVDFAHLSTWNSDLAQKTQDYHFRLEPYLRKAVQNFMSHHQREFVTSPEGVPREFWVSFYNLPTAIKLRDLKTEEIGKLKAFVGTCTRTSEVCWLCSL